MKPDLVGAKDIAARAGVKVDSVHKWRRRHLRFPEPLAVISDTVPVWDWDPVARWLATSGRWESQDGAEQPSETPITVTPSE